MEQSPPKLGQRLVEFAPSAPLTSNFAVGAGCELTGDGRCASNQPWYKRLLPWELNCRLVVQSTLYRPDSTSWFSSPFQLHHLFGRLRWGYPPPLRQGHTKP
eukprot:5233644-Pyramimonas_sp.AAC.1